MPKSEKRIEQEITLKASKIGARLFKNEVGAGIPMNTFQKIKSAVMKRDWSLVSSCVMQAFPIHFGLAKGSSDLIGITPIKITQEMVGKTIGAFLSIEVKKDKYGSYTATKEQSAWIQMIKNKGGIAAVIDDPEDLDNVISSYFPGVTFS